jgi:uncharacterized protein
MIQASLVTALLGLGLLLLVRRFQAPWWRVKAVRWGLYGVAVLAPLGSIVRYIGKSTQTPSISATGSLLAAGFILVLALYLSLPIAGIVRVIGRRVLGVPREAAPAAKAIEAPSSQAAEAPAPRPAITSSEPAVSRRLVLEAAVAAAPVTMFGLGAAGIVGGFDSTSVTRRRLSFEGLAPGLSGLRVMQITDLHLGAFFGPSSIPALVEKIAAASPDLLVFTGDICDHLPYLESALRQVEEVIPKLGAYAVMGNHEYYRGEKATRRIYDKTQIQMITNTHRTLDIGGEKLVLVGVDDPAGYARAAEPHAALADRALDGAPSDGFKLALCHRPSGFETLAARGIDLTLSGHTHGAQIGIAERSVLEPFLPDWYLWGAYERDGKQLYTSSGAGHWAAFRLACPSEAPVIEIVRG